MSRLLPEEVPGGSAGSIAAISTKSLSKSPSTKDCSGAVVVVAAAIEAADIFRRNGDAYERQGGRLSLHHRRVDHDLLVCRTSRRGARHLGGPELP